MKYIKKYATLKSVFRTIVIFLRERIKKQTSFIDDSVKSQNPSQYLKVRKNMFD